MLKKIFAVAMLLIALPVVANAYTLKTWVQTAGGNIVVGGGTPQTITTGMVYKTYTSSRSVTVTASTGYSIKSVVRNGILVAAPASPYQTTMNPADGTLQSVVAQFATMPASLSASVEPGAKGMVQPSLYPTLKSGKQMLPLNVYFTPYTGQQLTSIDGLAGDYLITNANTGVPLTLPAAINVKVKVSFYALPSGATNLIGHFTGTTPVAANAGPPQFVLAGRSQLVTLSGAASTGPITSYIWTQPAGQSIVLTGASTKTATFTAPSTPGIYKFDLTVTGSGATTSTASVTVTVSSDPAAVAWNQCGSCHQSNGIGQNPNIYSLWSTSAHNAVSASSTAYPVMCYACHIGAATGGHPGTPVATTQTVSALTWKAAVDAGPAKAGEYFCLGTAATGCHSPANIWTRDLSKSSHFANNNGSLCTSCHYNDSTGNIDIHNPAKTFEQGCGKCHAAPEEFAGSPHGSNPYNLFASECRTCHTGNVTLPDGTTARASKHRAETFGSADRALCKNCHTSQYSIQYTNWSSSNHKTTMWYQNPNNLQYGVKCGDCHNPHTTVAIFGAGTANGCQKCHKPGEDYSIYNADLSGKAPHYQTGTPDANGFYATGSYIMKTAAPFTAGGKTFNTQATCADCHGHNNTINAGYAEGGHGSTTAVPWKSDSGHIWLNQGPAANGVNFQKSPQQTNCIRCHSAAGYIQFVESGFTKIDRIKNAGADIKDSSPLTCNGCHSSPEGTLRLANFTTASRGAKGFKAFYGYSNANIAKKRIVASQQFANLQHSNVCMPCHSQRASGDEIKGLFAAAAYKQYSVGTAVYPHEGQSASLLNGFGAYEFGNYGSIANPHSKVGIGPYSGVKATQGPCVGCHYNAPPTPEIANRTHSQEAINTAAQEIVSTECVKCHGTSFNFGVTAQAKANYQAAIAVLGNALGGLTPPLNVPERRAMLLVPRTMVNDNLQNAVDVAGKRAGAWMNWYLTNVADPGGYTHNPGYSRKVLFDTIDYADDGVLNNSIQATIAAQAASGAITPAQGQTANAYFTDQGCLGCHSGTSDTAPVGIQRPAHYDYRKVNVPGNFYDPAFAPYTSVAKRSTQYYTLNNPCTACHTGNHEQPQVTTLHLQYAENVHANVNTNVWGSPNSVGGTTGGTDFKVRGARPGVTYTNSLTPSSVGKSDECVRCHTTTGFVNFATSGYVDIQAWGNAVVDKTKEVITCKACHTDAVGTVRTLDPWKAYVGYSAAVNARSGTAEIPAKFAFALPVGDLGKSNVCASCHSHGRNKAQVSGALVKQLNTFASYSVVRVSITMTSGHGNAIAAVPFLTDNSYVYKFNGQSYDLGDHAMVGVNNYNETGTGGPCAGCHLGTDPSSPKGGHTFEAWKNFSSTTAGNQWSASCYKCHSFNPQRINSAGLKTAQYGAFGAMTSIKRVLRANLGLPANKSLTPSATNPIRFYTGSASETGPFKYSTRELLQGANMNTLVPNNSWWLHGPLLGKQILFDSLDVALHGRITGSVGDLNTASGLGLTQDQIDRALNWFGNGGAIRPKPFNPQR